MQIHLELADGTGPEQRPFEIVERKGTGHPDTICDALSEAVSRRLCQHYATQFGLILHHNVDKLLLAAGQSKPTFGGGEVVAPMEIVLAGRATRQLDGKQIPIEELADEAVRAWLAVNLHALDVARHVRITNRIGSGSPELVELFLRQKQSGRPMANDTSCGVGFGPLSELERLVLAIEQDLNRCGRMPELPQVGEDVKVMGLREDDRITLTVSCALIGRFLADMPAYLETKDRLKLRVQELAQGLTKRDVTVRINAADDPAHGSVFLTVTGTSGECGDDGQTGRGNRGNGLITPLRPMTMEAIAGKNPVTHVGKLYNVAASRIAAGVVTEIEEIEGAECYLVSQIGEPVDRPRLCGLRVRARAGVAGSGMREQIATIVEREVAAIPDLWRAFLAGTVPVA